MRAFMSSADARTAFTGRCALYAQAACEAELAEAGADQQAEREARRILAETEPGFLLSGDHRSTTTAANWASEAAYVGRYFTPCDHYRDMGDCWIAVPWEGNAHAALAESLAAFVGDAK